MSPLLRNALGAMAVAAATTGVLSPSGGPKRAQACSSCYAVNDGCFADCSYGGSSAWAVCRVYEWPGNPGCWSCYAYGNCTY